MCEESTLNNNANFSKLDLSEVVNSNATARTTEHTKEDPTPNLSITLEQTERDILRKKRETSRSNSSVMEVSLLSNGVQTNDALISKSNSTNTSNTITMRDLNSTTIEEVSMIPEIDDDNDGKGKHQMLEESVISIDVDDDDDVQEVSCLEDENEQTTEYTLQNDMFSHLQINKTSKQDTTIEELPIDEDMLEVNTEPIDDESNLFQYPLIELGRKLWPSTEDEQRYTKGCLWSPDGTCLLVPVHLDGMHIVELPTDLYTAHEINVDRKLSVLNSAVHVKEGGTVYDYCWYPYMNSSDPATCW